jgi:hypothetical protein
LPRNRNYAKSAVTGTSFGETAMADHAEVEYASAEGNDYAAHEQTYETFIGLTKTMIAVIVAILVLMAYFLG